MPQGAEAPCLTADILLPQPTTWRLPTWRPPMWRLLPWQHHPCCLQAPWQWPRPRACPPPGTHCPSPMSASLQTSAVMVSSPSMPVAADEQREALSATDAGSPSAPLCRHCKIPPQNIRPSPPQLGASQCHLLKGSQTPDTSGGKKPQTHNWRKTHISLLFKLCLHAQSPFLCPFRLQINPLFCVQPHVPLNSTAAQGEPANMIYDSHVANKYSNLW